MALRVSGRAGIPAPRVPLPGLGAGGLWPARVCRARPPRRPPGGPPWKTPFRAGFRFLCVFFFFSLSCRVLSSALPPPRGSVPCRGNTKPRPRPKRFHFSGDEQNSPQTPRPRAAVYTQTRTPRRAPGKAGPAPQPSRSGKRAPRGAEGLRGGRLLPSRARSGISAPSPRRPNYFQSFMNFKGRKAS